MKAFVFIVLWLFPIVTFGQPQRRPFEYGILGGQKVDMIALGVPQVTKTEIRERGRITNEKTVTTYNQPIRLSVVCHENVLPGGSCAPHVVVNGQTFWVDQLLGNRGANTLGSCSIEVFAFSFQSRCFLLLSVFELNVASNYIDPSLILLDLTHKSGISVVLVVSDIEASPACFGDFNGDGSLDFAHRRVNGKRLECYTLSGQKFQKIPNKYLIINGNEGNLQVDLLNSYWFRDLTKR
jgi:hypothetical protein